jgi:hypothetical protein
MTLGHLSLSHIDKSPSVRGSICSPIGTLLQQWPALSLRRFHEPSSSRLHIAPHAVQRCVGTGSLAKD